MLNVPGVLPRPLDNLAWVSHLAETPRQQGASVGPVASPRRILVLLVLTVAALAPTVAEAQDHRLLQLDHPAYVYLQRLQRGGHLLELHPTALPYSEGDVRDAVDGLDVEVLAPSERAWARMLQNMLGARMDDRTPVGARGDAGLLFSNGHRPDPLRPRDDTLLVWTNAAVRLYVEHGPWIAQLGVRHDLAYRHHSDASNAARRLTARSDDAYLGYDGDFASVYFGRFQQQWGTYGSPAVLLSDAAFAFDQLYVRVGGERLAVRGLLAELDNLGPEGTFADDPFEPVFGAGSTRRYLAAHRIDWRPSRRLALTFMESALYSGQHAAPSLKYANPLHTISFVIANDPRNDQDNGMLAGMLWFYSHGLTVEGQLLIDDFDFINGVEPASMALSGQATYRLSSVPADLGVEVALATARAYNAPEPENAYVYLRQGLALAHNDFVRATVGANGYLDAWLPGLALMPQLHVLWQGERRILDPFPADHGDVDTILHGTTERTVRPAMEVFYQPVPWLWLRADLGVNVSDNADHIVERNETRFAGLLEFGVRLRLDRHVRLTF